MSADQTIITVLVAAIAAVPPTLLAWATLKKSQSNGKKSDTIIEKAEEIHVLTNSNLTKVKDELKTANEKIARLEEYLLTKPKGPLA